MIELGVLGVLVMHAGWCMLLIIECQSVRGRVSECPW